VRDPEHGSAEGGNGEAILLRKRKSTLSERLPRSEQWRQWQGLQKQQRTEREGKRPDLWQEGRWKRDRRGDQLP